MANERYQRNVSRKPRRNRSRKRVHQSENGDSGGPSTSYENSTSGESWSMEASDIAGYSYDPATKKYFKILPNAPGQPRNSTASDFRAKRKEEDRIQNIASQKKRTSPFSLLDSLVNRQLGLGPGHMLQRMVYESRLSSVVTQLSAENPPDITFNATGSMNPRRCRFMDVTEDGTQLICAFGLPRDQSHANTEPCSACVLKPKLYRENEEGVRRCQRIRRVHDEDEDRSLYLGRHVSSEFRIVEYLSQSCLLFADQRAQHADRLSRFVKFCPITDLADANENLPSTSTSVPLFESGDPFSEFVPHVGLHTKTSRIVYVVSGSFNHAFYGDLHSVSPHTYTPFFEDRSSFTKNPILAMEFDESGDLVYLASKRNGVAAYDLRTETINSPSFTLDPQKAIGYIRPLKTTVNEVVTCGWDGEAKLWDVRNRSSAVHTMASNKSTYFNLPCHIDRSERFLFSTAMDGSVSGWSLHTGKKICDIACPWAVNDVKADLPRVVYSENWGGRGAMMFAGKDRLNSFEIPLHRE